MTHRYRYIAPIGQLVLFTLTFAPICALVYWGVHHMWGFVLLGIVLQLLSIILLFIYLMGTCGFMDYTLEEDYVVHLIDEINYFYKRGYAVKDLFGNGSFHPGVTMVKPGMPEITLIYNYQPLKFKFSTSLIFKQYGKEKRYQYDSGPDMHKFASLFDRWFGVGDSSITDLRPEDFTFKARARYRRQSGERSIILQDRALVRVRKSPHAHPLKYSPLNNFVWGKME